MQLIEEQKFVLFVVLYFILIHQHYYFFINDQTKMGIKSKNEFESFILNIVVILLLSKVQEIHRDLPPAGEAVKKRLDSVSPGVPALKTAEEKSQKAYDAWAEKFKKKNGKDPGNKDRLIFI